MYLIITLIIKCVLLKVKKLVLNASSSKEIQKRMITSSEEKLELDQVTYLVETILFVRNENYHN